MSDDPTRPIDPTGVDRPDSPPTGEPTAAMPPAAPARTYETTTTAPPPQPPVGGAVSTGLAVAAAVIVGLLGLLAGYLVWGGGDEDTATDDVADTVPVDPAAEDPLVAERDELAQQVEEQQAQIDDLQSQLGDVTAERDELQAELDDGGDEQVTTVPAPEVTGGTVEDAQAVADENGWTIVEREVSTGDEDAGTVVAQHPEPGTPMIEGSVLVVDVATEAPTDS